MSVQRHTVQKKSLWGAALTQDSAYRPPWARSIPLAATKGWFLLLAILPAFGLLLGTAAFVWLGTWFRPPKPVDIILVGAGYETNLSVPPNVYGWRSLERLQGFGRSEGWPTPAPPLRLDSGVDWAMNLTDQSDTVMFYFSMHGGSDDDGPLLIPADQLQNPDKPAQPIRIAAILDRLAKQPAWQNKIVVFDATHAEAYPMLGILRNDFPRAMLELEEQIQAIPNLVVILASGPDQRSWSSPELGESVFGYFIREAFSGHTVDRNADGVIQLDEALIGLQKRVDEWAMSNRSENQQPVILPSDDWQKRAKRVSIGPTSFAAYELTDPPGTEPPAGVQQAWEDVARLRDYTPALEIYSPQLWQLYLLSILRYEQLLLAGDVGNAGRVRDRSQELELAMTSAARIAKDSTLNTLYSPWVTGYGRSVPEAEQLADELWTLSQADAAAKWSAALSQRSDQPPSQVGRFRLAVMRRFMELENKSPEQTLTRLSRLLQLVEDPSRPRPVESHFVALLKRDMADPPPPAGLIQHAIRSRVTADRCANSVTDEKRYPYSERVHPFIKAQLLKADQSRLNGQDRLFAAEAKVWQEADTALKSAGQGYQEALATAENTQTILTAITTSAAKLIYYSEWIAHNPSPDTRRAENVLDQRLQEIKQMWQAWHELVDKLPEIETADAPNEAIQPLAKSAEKLLADMKQLEDAFSQEMVDLSSVDLPTVWQEGQVGLRVPYIEWEVRKRLIANVRRASWAFFDRYHSGRIDPISQTGQEQRSNERASRAGLVYLDLFGRTWFNKPVNGQAVPGWESYDVVTRRLETFQGEPKGWQSLRTACGELGKRLNVARGQVTAYLESDQRDSLLEADKLTRVIPAVYMSFLDDNPASKLREFYLANFYAFMAERTWQEHWYELEDNLQPFFQKAGTLYLNDAAKATNFKEVQAKLASAGRLTVVPAPDPLGRPGPYPLTSERTATISALLEAEKQAAIPTGTAVWQPILGPGLAMADKTPSRQLGSVSDKPTELQPRVTNKLLVESEANPADNSKLIPTRVSFKVWYRGQRVTYDREIASFPRPDVAIYDYPPEGPASIAVRADPDIIHQFGAGSGAVEIVLDCSGSMGPAANEPFDKNTKYGQATHAIEQLLKSVPNGTRVGVRVFGQAVGAGRTAERPEETIQVVMPPTPWDPNSQTQLEALMNKLRYPALIPWNESPILRAMSEARADLQGADGFRTMIVLTDGMDNRFDKDQKLNPQKKPFPALLEELFTNTGITLHVVAFRVPEEEQDAVKQQFANIGKLNPPGTFAPLNELEELIGALKNALRQELKYRIETIDRLPVRGVGTQPLPVGTGLGGDRWITPPIPASGYRLRALAEHQPEAEAFLRSGDRLLLGMTRERGELNFSREMYSNDFPGKPKFQQRNWQLSVLQIQRRDAGMESLFFLEKQYDQNEIGLQLLRPLQTSFELDTPTGVAVDWWPEPDYPAPAWTASSPAWPTDKANLKLQAWWNPDQAPVIAGSLNYGADFHTLADLAGQKLFVDGEPVVIRDAAIEPHRIRDRTGNWQVQNCLTIRIAHSVDNDVQINVRGLLLKGSATWQFNQVNETTLLFWDDKDIKVQSIKGIDFISVRAMRRSATQRGFAVPTHNLPAPDPADERPQSPMLGPDNNRPVVKKK